MIDAEHTKLRLARRHIVGKCRFLKSDKWKKYLKQHPDKKTVPESWLSGCSCPIHLKGTENGLPVRESLGTNVLEEAEDILRSRVNVAKGIEKPEPKRTSKTVEEAIDRFITEHEKVLNSSEATVKKYQSLLKRTPKAEDSFSPSLLSFAQAKGIRFLHEFTKDLLVEFVAQWKDQNRSRVKKHERLKSFFKHAFEADWIDRNPAEKMKPPKSEDTPVVAYTDAEVADILQAAHYKSEQVELILLVLLYSGMAPVDVIQLTPDRLVDGRLILRREKTGVPVAVKLPPFLVERLMAHPLTADGYWFWNRSEGKLATATGNLRRAIRPVLKRSGVSGPTLYRFRHTFVYKRRRKGASYESIARLLGNTAKEVERSYSHFLPEEQTDLDLVAQMGWD